MSDVVIPEVFAIFEKKVATLVSYDRKTERARWDEAVIDLLKFFESIIARGVEMETQLATRDALIERLVDAGIEINSCTKVSTFSAEYYTLCKAQREWNEAVTDWEILKGGEK